MKTAFIRCPRDCSHRRDEGCLLNLCNPPPLVEEIRGVTVHGTAEGMLAPFMIVTHCERWYREMNKN